MTDNPIISAVEAVRPSLLTACMGFIGSTMAVTVLLVAFSQI